MAITSAEINNQSFSIDRKGYDVDEVDVFLEYVADEIDNLNATILSLNDRIAELTGFAGRFDSYDAEDDLVNMVPMEEDEEPQALDKPEESTIDDETAGKLADAQARIEEIENMLEARKLDDSTISKALIVAQRSAEEIIANANEEANQIIQDAEDDADRIIENAEKEKLKITSAIRILEEERDDTRDAYHDILADFITDASKKLADLDAAMAASVKSAHGRAARTAQDAVEQGTAQATMPPAGFSAAAAQSVVTNQVPIRQEAAGAAVVYTTPQMDASVATPIAQTTTGIEKDLSGFGDVEDEFEFGDIN